MLGSVHPATARHRISRYSGSVEANVTSTGPVMLVTFVAAPAGAGSPGAPPGRGLPASTFAGAYTVTGALHGHAAFRVSISLSSCCARSLLLAQSIRVRPDFQSYSAYFAV